MSNGLNPKHVPLTRRKGCSGAWWYAEDKKLTLVVEVGTETAIIEIPWREIHARVAELEIGR